MAIDIRHTTVAQVPERARTLGRRVKPIIRLGMGVKDPERGFPRKTDYFTVRGDERAVAKFKKAYGDQPKAVKIMVPSALELALDISYRSFVGGGDSEGGRPLALGNTNFAPLGYVGGPDVLRVWRQDGSYAEVETLGLDELGKPLDEIAADLKIEVHATFTFTIPDVLGWGSFAQVTSKGKKTADNLAFKLTEIYSAFGSRAPWAFDGDEPPLLVIKPDTALMRMEKDGEAKWAKTKIFVLDVVIPEAFDAMRDRLLERTRELAPSGAAAALYGGSADSSDRAAEDVTGPDVRGGDDGDEVGRGGGVAARTGSPSAPADETGEPVEEGEWTEAVDEPDTPDAEMVAAAGLTKVPGGVHFENGRTLADVAALGDTGEKWLLTQLRRLPADDEMRAPIETYARGALPELWARYQRWQETQ